MARVFLDANTFIDLIVPRGIKKLQQFENHELFISPLSVHIFLYVYKQKVPLRKLENLIKYLSLTPLDNELTNKALRGPTDDFEDNIQLHSAAAADCNFFLTNDQKLLNMRFFGRVEMKLSLVS